MLFGDISYAGVDTNVKPFNITSADEWEHVWDLFGEQVSTMTFLSPHMFENTTDRHKTQNRYNKIKLCCCCFLDRAIGERSSVHGGSRQPRCLLQCVRVSNSIPHGASWLVDNHSCLTLPCDSDPCLCRIFLCTDSPGRRVEAIQQTFGTLLTSGVCTLYRHQANTITVVWTVLR